jgi:hypothetical protein
MTGSGVEFEWTVKFSDILVMLGALYVGTTVLLKRVKNDGSSQHLVQGIAEDIEGVKDELKALAKVITDLAVQDTKITNLSNQYFMLQRTVEDLRRGSGWVSSPARDSVDGLYDRNK